MVNGMLENLNIPAPLALHYTYTYAIGLSMFLAHTAIFAVSYLLLRGYRIQAVENMARPAPFTAEQKRTLWLVCGVFLLIILPALLSSLLPASTALKAASRALNPTFLSFIGIVASLLLKVADERKAMENIPWSIIIMICGLGMLINLAVDRGAVDQIAHWVNDVQGRTAAAMAWCISWGPLLCHVAVCLQHGGGDADHVPHRRQDPYRTYRPAVLGDRGVRHLYRLLAVLQRRGVGAGRRGERCGRESTPVCAAHRATDRHYHLRSAAADAGALLR
ncbi:hypothetical protein N4G58_05490 [Edwardsiella piscicida]|nr:hypothetical protein N4G58_05490 [Edwardsiella piscicida]